MIFIEPVYSTVKSKKNQRDFGKCMYLYLVVLVLRRIPSRDVSGALLNSCPSVLVLYLVYRPTTSVHDDVEAPVDSTRYSMV
jgi:hypothetical protein